LNDEGSPLLPLDTRGALNNLQFTGDDFFADKDVCSIVTWRPNGSACGPARWTARAGGGSRRTAGARPAQAIFLVGAERDAYLAGEPADDVRFVALFAHALEHAGGYTPEEAIAAPTTPSISCPI
jgi:hypothetical protein